MPETIYVYGPRGEIYNISKEEMAAKLQAGEWFDLPAGSKVNMVDQYGTSNAIEFLPENILRNEQAGDRMEDSEVSRERWMQKKYSSSGQQALTAIESFADGATLGLSRYVQRGLGTDPREMAARRQYNEGTAMAGEIVGIGVSTIATGGIGAGGKAAAGGRGLVKKALSSTPAGLVARGGTKLRDLIRGGVTAQKVGAGRAIAANVVMGGFEGTFYGAGVGLSRAALEDLPLLSEETAGYVGMTALLGAGLGATVMGGGTVIGTGLRGAGKRAGRLIPKRKPRAVGGNPYKVGGPEIIQVEPSKKASFMRTVSGRGTIEDHSRFVSHPQDRFSRAAASNPEVYLNESAPVFHAAHKTFDKQTRKIFDQLWGRGYKPDVMRPFVKVASDPSTLVAGHLQVQRLDSAIRSLRKRIGNHPAVSEIKTLERTLKPSFQKYAKLADDFEAGRIGLEELNQEIFYIHDVMRKEIGVLANKFTKVGLTKGGEAYRDVAATMWDEVYEVPRRFLESVDNFGEAGAIHADVNAAYHEYLSYIRSGKSIQLFSKKSVIKGVPEFEPDLVGAYKHLKKVGTKEYRQQAIRWADDLNNQHLTAEVMTTRLGKMGPELKSARTAFESMDAHLKRMIKVNANSEAYTAITAGGMLTTSMGPMALGYMAGHLVAGYPGGLVGSVIGAAATPRNLIGALRMRDIITGSLEKKVGLFRGFGRATSAMDRQSTAGARSLLGKAVKWPFGKGKTPLAIRAFDDFRYEQRRERTEGDEAGYRRLITELQHLASPQAIQERLEANMPGLAEQFPEIVGHLNLAAQRAVNYLIQSAPPDLYKDGFEMIRGGHAPTASQALNIYFKKARIIENPQLMWELARTGRLSMHEIEALMAVYPEWTKKQIARLVEMVSQHKGSIPHNTYNMMTMLAGQPMGPSSQRWYLEQHQARYTTQQQQLMQPPKQDSEFSGKRRMADELRSSMQGLSKE